VKNIDKNFFITKSTTSVVKKAINIGESLMKNFKKILFTMGVALMAIAPSVSNASIINDSETVETVGIFVRGLKICHQREWRNLSVNLEYDADIGGDAADIQAVKEFIRTYLEEYSNPDDFWEIMNTKLVHTLSENFPDMIAIKSALSLAPDRTLHFPRESIVRYERGSEYLKESFNFTKLNYLICQETFRSLNLHVAWDMKDNPNPTTDYPDYQWIDEAMDTFFKEHPVSFSEWKTLNPQLQAYLLERFPTVTSMDVEITIVE